MRPAVVVFLLLAASPPLILRAQESRPAPAAATPPQAAPAAPDSPAVDQTNLPDIPTLMHQVETHERQAEAIQKNYIYQDESSLTELDGKGNPKKTVTHSHEYFWIDGVAVRRKLSEDGNPLSPEEAKKENDRIDKEVAKAHERRAKADAQGKETDSQGNDEITVSRMLELGAFTNPRRILVAGRPTILIDYIGDLKAKTHNPAETAFKELTGTVSIDEQDKAIQHMQARFVSSFKIGGGLLVNVAKDTAFELTFVRVNDEAWFLSNLDARGHARYLLFFSLNGTLHVHDSNFRKFKATSTISPTFTEVDPSSPTEEPPATPQPPSAPPRP